MKAIIVEDKPYIRKGLMSLLELVDFKIDVIGQCETVEEATVVTNACKPELVFLDINLPDGTAFDYLDKTQYSDFKVIFITAYEEYALKALKFGAVDYLLKPINPEELQAALQKVNDLAVATQKQQLQKAKQLWSPEDHKIILSLQDSFQVIDLYELMYCESDKGYTTFFCSDGKKHLVSKTLKDFEDRLSKVNFVRPHQSFMVNVTFIDKYDKSGVIHLKNGKKIPVASRKKGEFSTLFIDWNKA